MYRHLVDEMDHTVGRPRPKVGRLIGSITVHVRSDSRISLEIRLSDV